MRIEKNLRAQVRESEERIKKLLIEERDDDLSEEDEKEDLEPKLISTSHLGLEPGDIIIFNYNLVFDPTTQKYNHLPSFLTPTRMGIIVTSERTDTGNFISTRNNSLLNVFLLDSLSKSFYKIVVNTLYLDEIRCDYYRHPAILNAFLKKENFRTLNVKYLKNIRKVIIKVEKIRKAGRSQKQSTKYSASINMDKTQRLKR